MRPHPLATLQPAFAPASNPYDSNGFAPLIDAVPIFRNSPFDVSMSTDNSQTLQLELHSFTILFSALRSFLGRSRNDGAGMSLRAPFFVALIFVPEGHPLLSAMTLQLSPRRMPLFVAFGSRVVEGEI
jgi:hypothetical protein